VGDIYTPDYEHTIQCGLQKLTVYWTEARGGVREDKPEKPFLL
jgi:hypothetical protein